MQTAVHGTQRSDGMQDVCNDPYPRLAAAPEVSPEPTPDPCFGWRCPGCRSCHAPTLQTCPVCDARKLPLVQSFVLRTIEAELAAAPNTLVSTTAVYTTVHIRRLLEAVTRYHGKD